MSNFQTLEQELTGRTINGCDYGRPCRVLARTQDLLLLWVPGSKGSYYGATYHPAEMRCMPRRTHGWRELDSGLICSGERLHNRVFAKFANEIDSHLGEGFHALLDVHKTVVVGDNEAFSKYGHELPVTGREFGYTDLMEKKAIRERLISEGMTDELEIYFAVIREQETNYAAKRA